MTKYNDKVKAFYINIDKDSDEYGWIYLGLGVDGDNAIVFEELTGDCMDSNYMNYNGYEMPLADLKEISEATYVGLLDLILDGEMFDIDEVLAKN